MPHTARPQLGKFEGCPSQWVAQVLYDVTMISGQSDQLGDVDGFGWYALIHGNRWAWIVEEDSRGFFSYWEFPDGLSADTEWNGVMDEYEKYCANYELDA